MKFVKSNTREMQRKCKINKVNVKLYDKWKKFLSDENEIFSPQNKMAGKQDREQHVVVVVVVVVVSIPHVGDERWDVYRKQLLFRNEL